MDSHECESTPAQSYCVEKTEIPPFGYEPEQFEQPAGEVADEYGRNALWSLALTATEWALFPVASWLASFREPASMTFRTGVQGFADEQDPPALMTFPVAFHRLEAT